MEKEDDYLKEQSYIAWGREIEEAQLMKEILREEFKEKEASKNVNNQPIIIMKSPKIVLGKRKNSNSFDYDTTRLKFPRIITQVRSKPIRKPKKSNPIPKLSVRS
jgi:hypothetical protein